MTIGRLQVLRDFSQTLVQGNRWPRPVCPTCASGHVAFAEPATYENGEFTKVREWPDWDPEWIFGTFTCVGSCENPACNQSITALGNFTVVHEPDYCNDDIRYNLHFRVEFFNPPLALMEFPKELPDDVAESIRRAARLLFAEPGLAGAALRQCVERFLTSQGVKTRTESGGYLNLDKRIKAWRSQSAQDRAAGFLLAIKWLGNSGAHGSDRLGVGDVVDGAELIDEAFHVLYRSPQVDLLAENLNSRWGRARNQSVE